MISGPARLKRHTDSPSGEERKGILDKVTRGGPERPGSDEAIGEGPAPGTESVMGPVNNSGDVDSEHIPSAVGTISRYLTRFIETLLNRWHGFLD